MNNGPRPANPVRHFLKLGAWVVPGSILVLLPKCPLCLAAYLAIGSGFAISITTAAYLRLGLMVLSVASLTYFAVNRAVRFLLRRVLRPELSIGTNHAIGLKLLASLRK